MLKPKILIISTNNELVEKIILYLKKQNIPHLFLDVGILNNYEIKKFNDKIQIIHNKKCYLLTSSHLKSLYCDIQNNVRNESYEEVIRNPSFKLISDFISSLQNILLYNPYEISSNYKIDYQLNIAEKKGFNIPNIKITSDISDQIYENDFYIYDFEKDMYMEQDNLSQVSQIKKPLLIHEKLIIDRDISVFIFNKEIYAFASIDNLSDKLYLNNNEESFYCAINLPKNIRKNCISLFNELNLDFGYINLVENNGKFYFVQLKDINDKLFLIEKFNIDLPFEIAKFLAYTDSENKMVAIAKKYFYEIFPFVQLFRSNKYIEKEYDKLKYFQRDFSNLNYMYQQKLYSILSEFVDDDLKRKKSIEDKGKSSLFVFSLLTSVVTIGLSSIFKSSWGKFSSMILIIIIGYLCLAVITTLKTIAGKDYNSMDFDELYIISQNGSKIDIKEENIKVNIEKLYKYHELNQLIIVQKINALYTTFSLVQLSIILMVIFFVNLILTKYAFPGLIQQFPQIFFIIIRCISSFGILFIFLIISNQIKS